MNIGYGHPKKKWNYGKEYRNTVNRSRSASRNRSLRVKNPKIRRNMNETFNTTRITGSRKLFEKDKKEVIKPNPKINGNYTKIGSCN